MSSDNIIKKMTSLNQKLRYHSEMYHQKDNPQITDFEYDLLFNELRNIEEQYPELVLADSITQEVGYKIKKGFQSFTHPTMMGSLDNAMSVEEVKNFITKRNKDLGKIIGEYFLSLKLDGLALELIYQDNKLTVAATRGDGIIGENITRNALQVNNILKKLNPLFQQFSRLVIRGEVIMTKKKFSELNQNLEKQEESLFSNPRNAAAGTMRQLNEKIVKERKLFFYPYALSNWEECLSLSNECPLYTHFQQIQFIEKLGFTLNPYYKLASSFEEMNFFYENIQNQRYGLDYEIDGIVIKVNSGKFQNLLGSMGKRPRYAIAWKLPPEIKKTVIEDIVFQVGRTGKITPVAILKPIQLGGAQVQRATLHNFNEIKQKDIQINDTVEIIRSGDVIPKVLRVDKTQRNSHCCYIVFPEKCPVCSTRIETEENGILSFCRNQNCPSRQFCNILHFASKDGFDIEGLGKELIQELVQGGKLKDAGDIFLLTSEDFNVLKRVGDKLKSNLLEAIKLSKNIPMSRFLYALGIPTIGEKTAKILSRKFLTIDNLMSQTEGAFLEIDEIGEITAKSINNFFSSSHNCDLIKKILASGVTIQPYREQVSNKNEKLFNKKILFTGTLEIPRRRAKELAENAGAQIVSSVSLNLDYLVVGKNPGSKKKKAEKLHIKIIDETNFLNLLK